MSTDIRRNPAEYDRNPFLSAMYARNPYAYHATTASALDRIRKDGLAPQRQPLAHRGEQRATSEPALFFAVSAAAASVWGPVVLRFPWPDDDEIHPDPYSDTVMLPGGEIVESQWYGRVVVPPQQIEVLSGTAKKPVWLPLDERYSRNPPWADKIIKDNLKDIEAVLGPSMVPKATPANPDKWHELGPCGGYGCVYATDVPGIVMKLTGDTSEAQFVASCLQFDIPWHPGIVEYAGVYRLVGDTPRPGRPARWGAVCGLWRQEAEGFGEFAHMRAPTPIGYQWIVAPEDRASYMPLGAYGAVMDLINGIRNSIGEFGAVGQREYDSLTGRIMEGHLWTELEDAITALGEFDGWTGVSSAMLFYMGEGMLLGDVHGDNVGYVRGEDGHHRLVITDPGMMVPMYWKYKNVKIHGIWER